MRSRGSTALKKATPAQTIYQGSIADAAPTVIAPSSQRALKQARDRLLQEQKIQDQTLAREHNSEILGERLQNQIKLAALQTEQLATRSEQKLEQEHELNSFKIDKNHKIAQAGLNVAGVAAAGTVKSANLNAISQLGQGVISLSSSYVKGDAAITESTNRIYGGLPEQQQSANVDRYQRAVRAAGAQAIDEVTPDPFLRDSGKEGNADIHEKLTDLKLTNLSLANTIEAKLADFLDMNIPLEIGGRLISPLDGMATKEELNAYLHAAGTTIVLDFQKNGGQIKYGEEIGIRKSLEKGHNLQFQTWMPKILKLKTERRIKKAKDTFLSTVLLERTTPLAIAEGSDVHSMNKAIAALSEDNQIYFGGNRTQNNDAAVKQAIEALKEARRPDLLETLNNSSFVVTETHPDGQPNTQIGKKFGTEIIEAINDIERTEKTYQGFQINDIEAAMYKELNNNGNPAQLLPADREAIVFKAAAKMRSVGEYGMEKARELEDKIVELRSLSTTELNESRYYQSIVEHDPSVTQQTLDNDLAIGALKPEEHKRLSTTLKKVNEGNRVNSRQLQGQVTAQKAKFKGAILKAVGLKQDANGNPIDPIVWDNGKVVPSEAKLDPWQVAIVIEQANQDLTRLANTIPIAILNSGDEEKIAKHLTELYNTWWADNVANPDGRYGVIGEILSGSAMTEGTDTLPATLKDGIKDRLRELANNPTAINPQFRNAINSTKPIDWSESFRSLPRHKKNALARVIGEHRASLIKEEFKHSFSSFSQFAN